MCVYIYIYAYIYEHLRQLRVEVLLADLKSAAAGGRARAFKGLGLTHSAYLVAAGNLWGLTLTVNPEQSEFAHTACLKVAEHLFKGALQLPSTSWYIRIAHVHERTLFSRSGGNHQRCISNLPLQPGTTENK